MSQLRKKNRILIYFCMCSISACHGNWLSTTRPSRRCPLTLSVSWPSIDSLNDKSESWCFCRVVITVNFVLTGLMSMWLVLYHIEIRSRQSCSHTAYFYLTGHSPVFLYNKALLYIILLALCGHLQTQRVCRALHPVSGEDGILVAEVPRGVQHASSARTSPRRVVGLARPNQSAGRALP